MTTVSIPLTNGAYGFGPNKRRRVKPTAIACIHITGNSRTAANPDLHAAARGERNYANRAGSKGPSATRYIARDGWGILAVNPDLFATWSNGDVSRPNTANPGIRRVLALRAKGYNANEAYWEEFECVGYGSRYPITAKQKQYMAEVIAARSKKSGLPINRETVHGHWEINGIDRQNCPNPVHEAFLNDVIKRARAIASGATPVPTPPAEEIVKSFQVSESPKQAVMKEDPARPGNSFWLYGNSDLKPDATEVSLRPIRPLRYIGNLGNGVRIVAYEPAAPDDNSTSKAMFVRETEVLRYESVPVPSAPVDPNALAEARRVGFNEGRKAAVDAATAVPPK